MTECYRCGVELDADEMMEPMLFEGDERFMCEEHWLATKFLMMTREEPPFVDVGLYQEAVFYARQLAFCSLGKNPSDAIKIPDEDGEN